MNLAETLDRTARGRARFAALSLGDEVTSFAEVDGWSRRVAGLLAAHGRARRGPGGPGAARTCRSSPPLYYGILRLGAVVVPMCPTLPEDDAASTACSDSGAGVVVAWETARDDGRAGRCASLGVPVWVLGPGGLADLVVGRRPARGGRAPRRRRRGRDRLHRQAPDRATRRRRDHARQPAAQLRVRGQRPGAAHLPGRGARRRCRCATPFGQTAGLNASVRAGACLVLVAASRRRGGAGDAAASARVTVMEGGAGAVRRDACATATGTATTCRALRVCVSGLAADAGRRCCSRSRTPSTA